MANAAELKKEKTPSTEEVKKDFKPKFSRKREKDPNSVIGIMIEDMPISIKSILGEDNNVTIWGEVFGIEYFESSKSDFKIITLKVTDILIVFIVKFLLEKKMNTQEFVVN